MQLERSSNALMGQDETPYDLEPLVDRTRAGQVQETKVKGEDIGADHVSKTNSANWFWY